MKLLCVLLNYRTPDMTQRALDCLMRALERVPQSEVLVVDNDSGDGSDDQLRGYIRAQGYKNVRVLQTGHNGGFGYGNNHGIRQGLRSEDPPEYFYLLNSDAFVAEDAVQQLVMFLDQHPKAGFAGSYIHGPDGTPHTTAYRFPTPWTELEEHARIGLITQLLFNQKVPIGMPGFQTEVDWVCGASLLMRSTTLEEIGLFDETFFLYYEETELCMRAKRAGWQVWYLPQSQVAHIGSVSTGMKDLETPMPEYWFDSRRHYFLKSYGRRGLLAANVAHVAGAMLWRVKKRVQGADRIDRPKALRHLVRHALVGHID